MTGAAILPNLHSPIPDNFQYITLSDAGQHSSTSIRCYFHQSNCLRDYFNDPVPDGAVIMWEISHSNIMNQKAQIPNSLATQHETFSGCK